MPFYDYQVTCVMALPRQVDIVSWKVRTPRRRQSLVLLSNRVVLPCIHNACRSANGTTGHSLKMRQRIEAQALNSFHHYRCSAREARPGALPRCFVKILFQFMCRLATQLRIQHRLADLLKVHLQFFGAISVQECVSSRKYKELIDKCTDVH